MLALLAACSGTPDCPLGTGAAVRTELLFGLSTPGGGRVSPAEWQEFLDRSVTPRFPAGLTVLDGAGQWTRRDGRLSREPSKLLLVVAEPGPATLDRLDAVRTDYKRRFAQDSVGLVVVPACAAF